MKLIGRCGQQADACVMSLAEFQKAPPGTPAILAAAPVDFAQADAWIRSGAERILLEGDRLGDGELIHELAKSGTAVIVISSEMEEAIGISNRLLVMREGRISGMLEPEEMTSENTIRLMYRSE